MPTLPAMSAKDYHTRLRLYLAIASLGVIVPAFDSERPNWPFVLASALLQALNAWRAFIDNSSKEPAPPESPDDYDPRAA